MPDNQITILGATTKEGIYGIYNIGMLDDFMKKNPNKRLIITFQVEEKESKNAMIKYYNAATLPMWQKYFFKTGEVKSLKEIDKYLKKVCPSTTEKTSLAKLPKDELHMFLDFISIESLETANFATEDSRLI